MTHADTSPLRRFNRQFTQRIGALNDHFLGQERSLGPARLLFEIGGDGALVQELRERMGLDSGYLSRMLRGLESEGLVRVKPDVRDRRRRIAVLTAQGRREWMELERRSEQHAQALLEPLSERHRTRLGEALATAEKLLAAATVTFDVLDPLSEQAIWAVEQYLAELNLRFDGGFDVGEATTADAHHYRTPDGTFLVIRSADRVIGCGALCTLQAGVGEIKRMWVHESFRGTGLGPRLLEQLEQHARRLKHKVVRLDTSHYLPEAIALYTRNGYAEIERYNGNPYATLWFEKTFGA